MTLYSFSWRCAGALLGILLATAWSAQIALGTTYTFQNHNNSTSVDWHDSAYWNPSGVPNASGDAAIFIRPLVTPSGNFSILVDEDTTVGSITVDSTGLVVAGQFTIDGSGTLIFQAPSGPATFTGTAVEEETMGNQSQAIFIWNNISLLSDLEITHDIRPSLNASNFINGLITGASGLTITKKGAASIQLSNHNISGGFAGQYIIENGGIRFSGSSNLVNSTGVTVNSGGQLQLNADGAAATYDWNLADGAVLNLNGPGRTNLQGALRFQGAMGQLPSHSKFHNPVVLQTTTTIGVGPAEVTGELTNVVSGSGGLTKNGPGTLILSNSENAYAGNTTIQSAAGTLSLLHPTLANDADVLFSANNSFLNLNFDGTDIIRSFFIAGEQKLKGLWGATGNEAAEFTTDRITGNGLLDVRVGPGVPGDYNEDLVVNAADYVVWRDTMSDQPEKYDEWKANFGAGSPGSGADVSAQTAVPEPGALLLALVAACGLMMANSIRAEFAT